MNNWIWWMLAGIISLLGGIFALANPLAASITAEQLAAWAFVVAGIITISSAFGDKGWGARIVAVILGALLTLTGVNLLGEPLSGLISLTYFVAVMLVFVGLARIYIGFKAINPNLKMVMVISGILSLVLAFMIFSNFPQSAAVVLGVYLAIELISNGVSLIYLALARKNMAHNGF